MRAGPARRDPDFRGIDTDALGHLIKQVKDATTDIKGWLNAHPLPPEVPRTGVRMATEVDLWASSQLGMLTRRRNYALTHPDRVHEMPRTGTPGPGAGGGAPKGKGGHPGNNGAGQDSAGKSGSGRSPSGAARVVAPRGGRAPRHTTPSGAGPHLGNFPTQRAAATAAAADVLTLDRVAAGDQTPPDAVWRHLHANADDPDYTSAFYTRLGPEGTAALIAAAHHDRARLEVISESLGTGSHHAPIDEKWLRSLLADAGPAHRAEVVQVLGDAELSDRAEAALRRLGDMDAGADQTDRPHADRAVPSTAQQTAAAPAHVAATGAPGPTADRPPRAR
jgi:hypothetical protein